MRDLVGAIEELGYGVREKEVRTGGAEEGYRRRLIVAAVFALPVFVLGLSHGRIFVPHSS